MRTRVAVDVVARKTVYVTVEHDEGDDPCDLTEAERASAFDAFELGGDWECDTERIEVEP